MANRLLTPLLLSLMLLRAESRCGERLERALDMMQQRSNSARRRFDADDSDLVYRQRLRSAPVDVSVTRLLVEIPPTRSSGSRDGPSWAKVERCSYEPSNNSIRSRVGFNELSVSGLVQLAASAQEPSREQARLLGLPAESCRMSLRLRRAGMDFYTSPIARGRGQMRIRTESSFLEPRFASIYAYGCRPVGPAPAANYDRLESSEPRKREIGKAKPDSNAVSNSSALGAEAEEALEEENRLGGSLAAIPATPADALLDSLWRSRGDIAREMEDVFLRSASQAITHYIERQLHPAIKETLMLSMGYTISYG
ncbi:uncharacterized protein LOC100679530 [Nasonia vitripennis]|uniref:Uncharacterized protein n=1 Tax=Nasonia vitripennis TaxID=7425 RepID=A0A7M7QKR0_NASVI|nr:uncharacterized protein LOC100679530 [Nasonia vitripennis]XP_031788072.1 uncharacterized protein LOC100679530 [Nasonia vitripennis]